MGPLLRVGVGTLGRWDVGRLGRFSGCPAALRSRRTTCDPRRTTFPPSLLAAFHRPQIHTDEHRYGSHLHPKIRVNPCKSVASSLPANATRRHLSRKRLPLVAGRSSLVSGKAAVFFVTRHPSLITRHGSTAVNRESWPGGWAAGRPGRHRSPVTRHGLPSVRLRASRQWGGSRSRARRVAVLSSTEQAAGVG